MIFYVAVFGAGLAAGFLNVMAGGGSLITLPVLLLLGLPAAEANGTNRLAILVQNMAAVTSFRRQGYRGLGTGLLFAVTTIPGAVVGAMVATAVREEAFRAILAAVLILSMLGLVLPRRRASVRPGTASPAAYVAAFVSFFAIGFYGGFIQAGVGFLLMLVLHQLLGIDLVRTNMHKVLIVLVFSVPALAVFISTGNVVWGTGVVLAAGNAAGAVVATRVSVAGGDRPIRFVVAIALLAMAVRLVV